MENEKSIFNLTVEGLAKHHLAETSKWGKFLAIVGFAGIVLVVVVAAGMLIDPSETDRGGDTVSTRGDVIAGIISMIFFCVLYFFPCYYLLKFSNQLKSALAADDSVALSEAFKNLKITFRYIGIVTIISLVLLLLGFLIRFSENV